jgi:DNA topoisomerase-1
VVFNEITKRAIEQAFQNPGEVDAKKVDAQQTRRILDRLVGYKVSPILWDKVRRGLSAGRVQSVALSSSATASARSRPSCPRSTGRCLRTSRRSPPPFPANLVKKDGKNVEIANAARRRRSRRPGAGRLHRGRRCSSRSAAATRCPPFITSKLQQEAFKKLRFTVRKTMQVAQRLYEGVELGADGSVGLITYMRTDSTRVSRTRPCRGARAHRATYGDGLPAREAELLQEQERDAQDAHEAIRPTYLDQDPERSSGSSPRTSTRSTS